MARSGLATLGLVAAMWAAPLLADVKAGVDAWSRGDYDTAVREWRQSAINGDADAQFNLGQAYKLGRGVTVDLKAAEDWYRKAALQGHLQAEDNYGLILFQNGDRQRALPFIQKSARRGEPRAQYILGTALFNGDMVKKDWPRAYALMTRASAAGLGPASASLAQMDQYIPLEERQKGLILARDLEQQASIPLPLPDPVGKAPAKPAVVALKPAPKPPVTVAASKPVAVVTAPGGKWHVQLGAFSDQAKAIALWAKLKTTSGLSGLQPNYLKAGTLTRLQAGPIASRAAAEKICGSVKVSGQVCLPVGP